MASGLQPNGDTSGNPRSPTGAGVVQPIETNRFPIDNQTHSQYMHMDQIGSGFTGYVEEVKDRKTGLFYARKRIEIKSHSTRRKIQEVFANEVKTIRSLEGHSHFVRVLAAYATEHHFNLVLQPRADEGDLARFLDVYLNPKGKIPDSRKVLMAAVLEQAFGCLASGLAFMHKQKIRHRDVKPNNILIHKGAVLWADFGYSRDSSLFEHSATKGPVDAQTHRYSAPEVLSWTERDSKADVYSLGCVFLEIFYALAYDKAALKPGKWFSKEMNHLTKEIASAEFTSGSITPGKASSQLTSIAILICCMTLEAVDKRPEANELCCNILLNESFGCCECRLQLPVHQKVRMSRLIGPISDDLEANEGVVSTTSAISSASLALSDKNNFPIMPHSLLVLGKEPRDFDNTTTPKNIPSTHPRTAELSSITADYERHLPKSSGQKPRAHEVQYPPDYSTHQMISHPRYHPNYHPSYHPSYNPSYDAIQAQARRENMSRHTQDDEPISRALGQQPIESVQVTSSVGRNTSNHDGASHEADSGPSLGQKLAIEAARILAISGAVEGFRVLTSRSPVVTPITKTQSSTSYINSEQTIDPGITVKLSSKSPADLKPNNGYQVDGTLASVDSRYNHDINMAPTGGESVSKPKARGGKLEGTYGKTDSLHYEAVDMSYFVRSRPFFSEGRVLAVIMNETIETKATQDAVTDYNSSKSINRVKYKDNFVYTDVRRFVVVRQKRNFCYACPIFTYGGKATTKRGVRASEHGIAYSWGKHPQLIAGESGITKSPISVIMTEGAPNLDITSRIFYGIVHPIQYNIKAKEIGYVPTSQIPSLIGNWKQEEDGGSNQDAEITQNTETLEEDEEDEDEEDEDEEDEDEEDG